MRLDVRFMCWSWNGRGAIGVVVVVVVVYEHVAHGSIMVTMRAQGSHRLLGKISRVAWIVSRDIFPFISACRDTAGRESLRCECHCRSHEVARRCPA